jgi:5-methylcytosine-specific restriction protein A
MTRLKCLRPILAPAPATQGWKPDTVRGTRHQRGYGTAWEKLRAEILRRDEGLCQPCLAVSRVAPGTEVDHRIPKAQGGTDSPSNLQAICRPCHLAKTARESTNTPGGT